MNLAILTTVSFLLSTGANAQVQGHGYVTFNYPQIEEAFLSHRSSYDGICKALLGKDSTFVDGSRGIDRPKLELFNSSQSHMITVNGGRINSVLVGPSGEVQKVYADRKPVISKISCWGELPKPQTTPSPTPMPTPVQSDPVKFELCLDAAKKLYYGKDRYVFLSNRCVPLSDSYSTCLKTVLDNLYGKDQASLADQCTRKFQ